ncbi:MAG: acetate--CoA ligase family protein [Syntrophorhabdus sp.]
MEKFFHPKSIAVFGVSSTNSNLARIIIENLNSFHFSGHVYPVGTHAGTVAGREIIHNIEDIPIVPDLAVILVPARYAPETLEACGKIGIRNVVLESGGFSELSQDRNTLEEQVLTIADRYDMRVIGPNCFGIVNLEAGVVLPFFIIDPAYMRQGSASLISQSGGIFYDTCMLSSVENVGLRKLVSIGNKLMTDENDILEYIARDEGTRVAGLYLESFSNGRRFIEIVQSAPKPVVVLKANRSQSSSEIAHFHTTALAGDDDVAEAAIRQAGAIRVDNFQEMIDCFKIFSLPVLKGKRLALISRSGGHGVLCADAARKYGFEFAPLSERFFDCIYAKKLNVIAATNPVDIGDVYDLDEYGAILDMALSEKDVDGIVFIITYSSESDGGKVVNFIRHAADVVPRQGKPVALCVVTNRAEWFAIKEAADFPVFTDADQAMKALRWSWDYFDRKRNPGTFHPGNIPVSFGDTALSLRHLLPPQESFGFLAQANIPVAQYAIAQGMTQALDAARRIGYPVALKAADPGLLHKSELQGVVIHIENEDVLRDAMRRMPGQSYLVQKMARPGYEVIVGGRFDNEFGPVVMCGLGGIFTEILADRSIRVAPVSPGVARQMIDELKGSEILKGARGRNPADIDALTDLIVKVSHLLVEHPGIVNLDINPVIVYGREEGCVVVDAKIERQTRDTI